MSKYTQNPQTVEEAIGNVQFQLDNVEGWNSVGKMEEARIKAHCLVEAAQLLSSMLKDASLEKQFSERRIASTPIPEPL